jgi:hypothetical protein
MVPSNDVRTLSISQRTSVALRDENVGK